ncbi:nicotinamide mononucleotide transporter [Chitinophaga caeni]|uniref:Nicotinamide riboside transporter PnuC n=1 Tax=Chitinophaga caeni TaxID=2029983 RepID=A0A291QPR0_9BACT|nr:nicotinamide riboside transporter PnuC [Chitinophaga caeni]ATL45862.1 nicotinamide mononucleotide transporter [Chitinophaga caeni]
MNFFDIHDIAWEPFGYQLSFVELAGTVAGIFSVWLAAKENKLTWVATIVNVICFFAIFYQVQLYSNMLLQVYFFFLSIYGWFTWNHQQREGVPVRKLTKKQCIYLLVSIPILTACLGWATRWITTNHPAYLQAVAYPYVDAFIAIASIVANTLLAKRIIENWILWIIIDVFCIYLYAQQGILLVMLEYALFLILSSYGYFAWRKELNNDSR